MNQEPCPQSLLKDHTVQSPVDAPRKRWTRAECATLEASGLWDQQRLELVHGELISVLGKKRPT
jgi:hypothetical protein